MGASRQRSEDERKAMWARMGGGGGGGGRSTSSSGTSSGTSVGDHASSGSREGMYVDPGEKKKKAPKFPTPKPQREKQPEDYGSVYEALKSPYLPMGTASTGGGTGYTGKPIKLPKAPEEKPVKADGNPDFVQQPDGSYRYQGADADMQRLMADGRGISTADSDALALLPLSGRAIKGLQAAAKSLQSWKLSLSTGAASETIGSYRDANATMDPTLDHALALTEQGLGYISAASGLGTARTKLTSSLGETAAGKAVKTGLGFIGDKIAALGKAISTVTGSGSRKLVGDKATNFAASKLSKLYEGYNTVADYTGASLTDAVNAPKQLRRLRKAQDMLARSKKLLLDSANMSPKDAYKATIKADKMRKAATAAIEETKKAMVKAALVGGAIGTKEAYDQNKISGLEEEARTAFDDDRMWAGVAPDKARDPFETAAAMLVGTLGNPLEKQFRSGQEQYYADIAAYRAGYYAIKDSHARGEMSDAEKDSALYELSKNKPKNMAGKALWTVAPAASSFLTWKGKEYSDRVQATGESGIVTKVLDGDTIEIDGKPTTVRLAGINAGETDKGRPKTAPEEYYGKESKEWLTKELLGKAVRLVHTRDNGGDLMDLDVHGRELAYVETLPGGADKLLTSPLGKYIPFATDVNLKAIETGNALPKQKHERLAGGKHDRRYEYDEAAGAAMDAKIGMNDQSGNTRGLPTVPDYKTFAQRNKEFLKKKGYDIPDTPQSDLSTILGLGLMASGNSGIFNPMGAAGGPTAQLYNAILAVRGAKEYNQTALQKPKAREYRRPKGLPTREEAERTRSLLQDEFGE